jgi:hypothetical protein
VTGGEPTGGKRRGWTATPQSNPDLTRLDKTQQAWTRQDEPATTRPNRIRHNKTSLACRLDMNRCVEY